MSQVHVVDHPLVKRSLTILRDEATLAPDFRLHLRLIARFLAAKASEDVGVVETEVRTPLQMTSGTALARPIVLAPILRAGLGMAEGMLEMVPDARMAHLGLYRDEETLEPKVYYESYPPDFAESHVVLVDPMLATGGSSVAAADMVKAAGATSVSFLNLVSCPEGIAEFHKHHPDICIVTASVDEGLNEKGYIVPGLGDAGDRYFGTC
ncbi:MAG: uracil phosphoribosyltransferase [Verrucomicrobiota bacterium JB023]|nr:uracil phosphoribosyltransferase [Verrucomicrobiota bacterium JB023]